jgi:putative radical SAM enzyme (TIGR03279 family)
MIAIERIEPGSFADDAGLCTEDLLVTINAKPVNDLVDYYRALEAEHLVIEVFRQGEILVVECEKFEDEEIGIDVAHPEPHQCGNQCLFCFVHQLPKGLRSSLYIKDEDYRFSYLYGSFITLTNVSEADFQRITTEKLSPLYISVHATDPEVRNQLLGCRVPALVPLLKRLALADIQLHCQIVLCPGINDGAVLQQTIEDLAELYPQVHSIAVVPVGLTRFRQHLPVLQVPCQAEAKGCIEQINVFQGKFLEKLGTRLVYVADEMYQLAGLLLPSLDEYEDLPQLENGVGLVAQFRAEAEEVLLEAEPLDLSTAVVVTGQSFCPYMQEVAKRMGLRTGVDIEVVAIGNDFFGSSVTVAGLVTGIDLVNQLRDMIKGRPLLVPDVMLKADDERFLDDMYVDELRAALGVTVVVVESSAWGLLEGLEFLAQGTTDVIRC